MNGSQHQPTLVLAAHGASEDPRCAAPVLRCAEAIRAKGVFPEVRTIFWKEEPRFHRLYEITEARELLVVPFMMAGGYYAKVVLPRELRAGYPPAGRTVTITEAVGEQSALTHIIVAQAASALAISGYERRCAHLMLVGHGTRRDPVRSGESVYRHAAVVRSQNVLASVSVGFLDQDPEVQGVLESIRVRRGAIVVVPMLVASGGHGSDDIPIALGAEPGAKAMNLRGQPVLFADAVGEHPGMAGIVLGAANRARNAESQVA